MTSWRNSQLRPLGKVTTYRQRTRRAWLVLWFAVALVITAAAARELLG